MGRPGGGDRQLGVRRTEIGADRADRGDSQRKGVLPGDLQTARETLRPMALGLRKNGL